MQSNDLAVLSRLIQARKSTRAFLDKPVELEKIDELLTLARHAPSGTNTQPWRVYVLQGRTRDNLVASLTEAFDAGEKESMDYSYYPEQWVAPYKQRRLACGLALYSALDITREDKDKQRAHWRRNFEAFNAPVILMFTIDRILDKGSYLDYGMFLQNLSLSATAMGLGSCAQAALANYPQRVRKLLGLDDSQLILCGMGIGYEDSEHPLNQYRTEREPVETFRTIVD